MKALLQIGSSLSACLPERVRSQSGGHAQAGGRVPVPPEKRFLINHSAEALLWLGRKAEVLASWEYVKGFQREDGLVPFAILPDSAGTTSMVQDRYPLVVDERGGLDGNPPAGPVWHGFAPFFLWGKAQVRNLTIDGYSRVEERQACNDIHIEPEVVVDGMTLRDFRTVNRTPGPIVLLNNRGTVRNLVLDDICQIAEGAPARGGLIRNSGTLSDVRVTGEGGENLAELIEGMTGTNT